MSKTKTATKNKPEEVIAPANELTPTVGQAEQLMMLIDKHAGTLNVEKMRAMLDMQKEIRAEDRRVAYSAAMVLCQKEMEPVVRKAENKHTRSRYAKLEAIDKAIRPIYTKHGFSLSFDSEEREGDEVLVMCDVMHDGGHTVRKRLQGKLDMTGPEGKLNKTSIQGLGSSVSYLIRYLTIMIFNIVLTDEDNDGNATGAPVKKKDEFAEAVAANKKSAPPKGKVSEAEYEEVDDKWNGEIWDGDPSGDPMVFTGEPKAVLKKSGTHLMTCVMKVKKKTVRQELISNNTALLRALSEGGQADLVQSLHELVDKGA